MYIYSEKLNKRFDTVEECVEAEQKFDEEQKLEKERKAKLTEDRKIRAKEVEDAYKLFAEKLKTFVDDYGAFHFTINSNGSPNVEDLVDFFSWLSY